MSVRETEIDSPSLVAHTSTLIHTRWLTSGRDEERKGREKKGGCWNWTLSGKIWRKSHWYAKWSNTRARSLATSHPHHHRDLLEASILISQGEDERFSFRERGRFPGRAFPRRYLRVVVLSLISLSTPPRQTNKTHTLDSRTLRARARTKLGKIVREKLLSSFFFFSLREIVFDRLRLRLGSSSSSLVVRSSLVTLFLSLPCSSCNLPWPLLSFFCTECLYSAVPIAGAPRAN